MYEEKHCNICLKPKKALFSILQCDVSNTTYLDRLQFAVPEIIWDPGQQIICYECTQMLQIAAQFKEMCCKAFDSEFKLSEGFSQENFDCNGSYLLNNGLRREVYSDEEDDNLERKDKLYKCKHCDKSYKTRFLLKNHITAQHTDPSFWVHHCYACDKTYSSKSTLVTHVKLKHKQEGRFNCYHCSDEFRYKHLLYFHIKDKHSSIGKFDRLTCDKCEKFFTVKSELIVHAKNEHKVDKNTLRPYKCEECNKRYKDVNIFNLHKLYHKSNKEKENLLLNESDEEKLDLLDEEKRYQCKDCLKTFKTQRILYSHRIAKHVPPENFNYCCNICNKRFMKIENYKMHLQRHLGIPIYPCRVCNKKFVNKVVLGKHLKCHAKMVKRVKCKRCGQKFRDKSAFRVHLHKDHGVSPIKRREKPPLVNKFNLRSRNK